MPRLPFDVIVWVKKTDSFAALRDELIGLAADEPDESGGDEETVDFHWRFDNLKEAESVAEVLTAVRQRPEIILLRLSNYDAPETSVTFKDERDVRH
jgi:hypothetical protein